MGMEGGMPTAERLGRLQRGVVEFCHSGFSPKIALEQFRQRTGLQAEEFFVDIDKPANPVEILKSSQDMISPANVWIVRSPDDGQTYVMPKIARSIQTGHLFGGISSISQVTEATVNSFVRPVRQASGGFELSLNFSAPQTQIETGVRTPSQIMEDTSLSIDPIEDPRIKQERLEREERSKALTQERIDQVRAELKAITSSKVSQTEAINPSGEAILQPEMMNSPQEIFETLTKLSPLLWSLDSFGNDPKYLSSEEKSEYTGHLRDLHKLLYPNDQREISQETLLARANDERSQASILLTRLTDKYRKLGGTPIVTGSLGKVSLEGSSPESPKTAQPVRNQESPQHVSTPIPPGNREENRPAFLSQVPRLQQTVVQPPQSLNVPPAPSQTAPSFFSERKPTQKVQDEPQRISEQPAFFNTPGTNTSEISSTKERLQEELTETQKTLEQLEPFVVELEKYNALSTIQKALYSKGAYEKLLYDIRRVTQPYFTATVPFEYLKQQVGTTEQLRNKVDFLRLKSNRLQQDLENL